MNTSSAGISPNIIFISIGAGILLLYAISIAKNLKGITRTVWMVLIALSVVGTALFILSPKDGYAVAIGFLDAVLIFIEPYFGLLNYLFFTYIRPQELTKLFVKMPIMMILGVYSAIVWIIHTVSSRGDKKFFDCPQDVFMMLLMLALIGSHIAYFYTQGAMDTIKEFMDKVIIYFLCVSSVTSLKRLKATMWVLVLLTMVLAIQGIVQFYTGVGLGGQVMVHGRIRSIGIFSDPNDLALTFVIIIPILLYHIFGRFSIFTKILSSTFAGAILYAIYLTNSRGGMLSLAAVCCFYAVKKYSKIAGIVVSVLIIVAMIAAGPSRFSELTGEDDSSQGRIDAWREGIYMLRSNPIFGIGYGMFTEYHHLTAHNSFVLVIAETGILGAFFWVGVIYFSVKSLFTTQSEGKKIHQLIDYSDWDTGHKEQLKMQTKDFVEISNLLQASFVGFMASAFFLSRSYNILLYILVGLATALYKIKKREWEDENKAFRTYDIIAISSIVIFLLSMIYMIVRFKG